jgi:hypothetical protein
MLQHKGILQTDGNAATQGNAEVNDAKPRNAGLNAAKQGDTAD